LQPTAGLGQPAGNGPLLDPEPAGDVGPRLAVQGTENERHAVAIGEQGQLFFEESLHLAPGQVAVIARDGDGGLSLVSAAAGGGTANGAGHTGGDSVQPAADGRRVPDGRRVAGQKEKGGLEHVVRVGRVPGPPTCGGQHERAVPAHQGGECSLVPIGDEGPDEVRVRRAVGSEGPDARQQCGGVHGRVSDRVPAIMSPAGRKPSGKFRNRGGWYTT
jgi:hypothetical protein